MRTPWLKIVPVILGLASLAGAGCTSSSPGSAPTVDAGPGNVTCTTDPRAEIYTANMAQMGASGAFKFVLVQADPSPPIRGTNTWTLKLIDKGQNTVTGATVDVVPFMPDHGHGSSVNATATPAADGSFTVTPLYLFMPGIWRVTFTAHAGAVTDSAVFFFCIEG